MPNPTPLRGTQASPTRAPAPSPQAQSQDLERVSGVLEGIFNFYAITTGGESAMTLSRFQRMCLDADIIDQKQTNACDPKDDQAVGALTSAQVDLIFKRTLFRDATQERFKSASKNLDSTYLVSPGIKRELQMEEPEKQPPCKTTMTLPQFMDAIVVLAATKYPLKAAYPRDAVYSLFEEYFSTFAADPAAVHEDWIEVMQYAAAPLYEIYVHYFPLEMNPHLTTTQDSMLRSREQEVTTSTRDEWAMHSYKERQNLLHLTTYTASMARAETRKAVHAIVEDYELTPQYSSRTADTAHALRQAFDFPVPKKITENITLPFAGKIFTFHHFLVMLQALANVLKGSEVDLQDPQQPSDGAIKRKHPREYWYTRKNLFSNRAAFALRILLTNMDQTRRPQAPLVQILGEEHHHSDKPKVEISNAPTAGQEEQRQGLEDKAIKQVFEFYVTLGEPLAKHMSIRKFNRFLRDCSVIKPHKDEKEKEGVIKAQRDYHSPGYGVSPQSLGPAVDRHDAQPTYSTTAAPKGGFSSGQVQDPRVAGVVGQQSNYDNVHASPMTARSVNDQKLPTDSGLGSNKKVDRLHRKLDPLPAPSDHLLSQVQADMIFLQCKQPKLVYSHYAGQDGFDFRKKPDGQGLSRGKGYYRAEDAPGDHRTKPANKLHVDLQAFKRAIELISDKIYPDQPSVHEARATFVDDVLEPLSERLCRANGQPRGQRPLTQSWEDDAAHRNNVETVSVVMRKAFERVYADFLAGENPGLTMQNFMAFTDEFGILKELKLLTIQRTFAMVADEPEFYIKDGKRCRLENTPKKYMSLEPFCRAIVYLAVAAIDGPYEPHEKMLLLGHLMNATPGAVRLAHTRDLFPVEQRIKEIQGPMFHTREQHRWSTLSTGAPQERSRTRTNR